MCKFKFYLRNCYFSNKNCKINFPLQKFVFYKLFLVVKMLENAVIFSVLLSSIIGFVVCSLIYFKAKRQAYLNEHTKPYHQLRIRVDPLHPEAEAIKEFYAETLDTLRKPDDSGVDLYAPEKFVVDPKDVGTLMPFGISAEFIPARHESSAGYYLVPRSSIFKTPIRQSNSVGIIDAGYRGQLCAPLDNKSNTSYTIEKSTRLFQIVAPDLAHIRVTLVEKLSETDRGTGGFGSTGK
jgi:dUTP pyrophosphatase